MRMNQSKPTAVTPQLVDRMVRRLVRRFNPEQIILFGSHARGAAGPDSDVNLLVVIPVTRADKRNLQLAMRLALHEFIVPLDIIVISPEEVQRRRNIPGTIIRPALREGKVLYARS
jgi:predicted nucleotidyltransferase